MKLPNFGSPSSDSSSKIGRHFSNKMVLKLKSAKNAFYKKGALKLTFLSLSSWSTKEGPSPSNNFVGMHSRWSIMGHILSTQFVNAPFESKVETVIIIAIVQKRMFLV